ELRAGDEEERDQDDRADAHLVARETEAELDEAEDRAGCGGDEPERVEEHERVEVADHVLLAHPPEERLPEQPRDLRDDVSVADPAALADAVDRTRREVAHARVDDV